MTQFNGKYKMETSENFEEFMQALGVNIVLRKIGNTAKPTLTIHTEDGKHFKFLSESTFKNVTLDFTLDEEQETTSMDGRKTKNITTLSGNTLTQIEKPHDGEGKEATYIRELTDSGDLKVRCSVGDIVSTRLFKRL